MILFWGYNLLIETSCPCPKFPILVGHFQNCASAEIINLLIEPVLQWNRQKEIWINYKQFNFIIQSTEIVLKTLEALKEMHGASLDIDGLARIAMLFGTPGKCPRDEWCRF